MQQRKNTSSFLVIFVRIANLIRNKERGTIKMPAVYRSLILHFAWSTRGRHPYITPVIERRLHRMIQAKSAEMGCPVLAINGMPDHIHLLVEMNHNLSCADFMQTVKGASSAFARNTLLKDSSFSWQHGYGVFSVSHDDIPDVITY